MGGGGRAPDNGDYANQRGSSDGQSDVAPGPASSRRDQRPFAVPEEAEGLIAALPSTERAFWATAFYAGLRRGELVALHVGDGDLETNVIHVRRGWDRVEWA